MFIRDVQFAYACISVEVLDVDVYSWDIHVCVFFCILVEHSSWTRL